MTLEQALTVVRAAGYRVSKPKPRKQSRVGPTCVVRFADGTLCRMTTHCSDTAPDYERGTRLCRAAWSSRHKLPVEQSPAVASIHFERDGERFGQRIGLGVAA